jgi:hypothetical protein
MENLNYINTNKDQLLTELLESGSCQAREGSDSVKFIEENDHGKWYELCDHQGTTMETSLDPEFLIVEMIDGEISFQEMVGEEE